MKKTGGTVQSMKTRRKEDIYESMGQEDGIVSTFSGNHCCSTLSMVHSASRQGKPSQNPGFGVWGEDDSGLASTNNIVPTYQASTVQHVLMKGRISLGARSITKAELFVVERFSLLVSKWPRAVGSHFSQPSLVSDSPQSIPTIDIWRVFESSVGEGAVYVWGHCKGARKAGVNRE